MFNNNDGFRNLREQREQAEKAFNQKQETIKMLNERFIQNQARYERIVAQVLEELKEAMDPDATIVGPEEIKHDLGEALYSYASDMLGFDSRSKPWRQYFEKAGGLRGLGDQRYLRWGFRSKNKGFVHIYIGLINYQTIGFICDYGRKLGYGEFSRNNLVHELGLFFGMEYSDNQQVESVKDQTPSEQKEVSISLDLEDWKIILKILEMYCQSQGKYWVEWQREVNSYIKTAIEKSLKTTSKQPPKRMSLDEMDIANEVINDEIVSEEAMDVYEEFEEYYDDD